MMRTRLAVGALVALVAGTVSGCGSDDPSASGGYCDRVAEVRASFVGLLENSIDQQQFDGLLADLAAISRHAPADIRDDWAAFHTAAADFNTALHKDGMTIDDVAAMQEGPMEDSPEMDAVMAAASELSSLRIARVQGRIATEAKRECGVSFD